MEILHDNGLRQQYDARLLQELQQLRTQNEQEMQLSREEIASQYEKKVSEFHRVNYTSALFHVTMETTGSKHLRSLYHCCTKLSLFVDRHHLTFATFAVSRQLT